MTAQTASASHASSESQPPNRRMQRMLRISGAMLILGLLIEGVSLHYNHPLSFLAFMFIGGALLVFGVVIYLVSLVVLGAA